MSTAIRIPNPTFPAEAIVGPKNPLPVVISQQTAFGEVLSAPLTPFVQATAAYNLIPANIRTYTATGGGATASGNEFVCTTGTSVGGYGTIRSVRSVNYKGGMGAVFRGTGRFTAGVANSIQGVGFFNVGDAYLFGYSGADFGIIYQHGGLQEVRTITVTGASGGSTNLTLTLNDEEYTIPLTAGTTAHNAFEITEWLAGNQTAWNAYQNGATVVISAASDGPKSGEYAFTHGSATGGIAQTTAGVSKTTEFYPRSEWNRDTCDWIDPTLGNVYQIKLQYLGYGAISFFVESPSTGDFTLVHVIEYANSATTPSVGNPSLRCGLFAASLGSTTNLTVASGSFASFVEGTPGRTRNPRATSNNKSVGTTLTNILTLRTRDVFGGKANQVEIEPVILTAFTESAKGAKVGVYTNATLGGEPNYSYLGAATLVSEVDTAATTVDGGNPLLEFQIAANSSAVIDLSPLRIRIPPNVRLTVAAAVNSGAASAVGIGLSWYEDL